MVIVRPCAVNGTFGDTFRGLHGRSGRCQAMDGEVQECDQDRATVAKRGKKAFLAERSSQNLRILELCTVDVISPYQSQ